MYINKKLFWLTTITAILSVNKVLAQTKVKTDSTNVRKSFVLQVGGGFSSYSNVVHIQPQALSGSINRFSPVGTLRIMWYPSYRLRLGIETGYTQFYSYRVKNGNTEGSLHLSTIPILFVFSMQIVRRVNVYAGIGAYLETTHLNYNGKVKSKDLILGTNIALSYTYPVSNRLSVIAEGEWMDAIDTKDAALNLQVKLGWRFIQYR